MKHLLLMALGLFAFNITVSACENLSGTYEFKGFDGQDCKINNDEIMHISPLPLGSAILANGLVKIQQNFCHDISLIYADDRYTNTGDTMVEHKLDLKWAKWKNGVLSYKHKENGTVCKWGCLTTNDTTKWSLRQDTDKNLIVTFNHSSVGLYNFVIPTVDVVRAKCKLERIGN